MRIVFDIIIFGFLLADGWLTLKLTARLCKSFPPWKNANGKPAKNTHAGFTAILFAVFLLMWLTVFYGSFVEPHLLVIKKQQIKFSSLPRPTVVALAADFHAGPYKQTSWMEKTVSAIMASNPDIIVLAGDFVFDDKEQVKYLEPLKKLYAPLGVYAVLGNHDYAADKKDMLGAEGLARAQAVAETLKSCGIKVLINKGVKINLINNDFLFLFGVDDIWTGRANLQTALATLGLNNMPHPSIVISHNPDEVSAAENWGADLVLSGHTHGGQIRLPFLGPVPPLPDELGRKYDKGIFDFGKTQLFITNGAGEIGARARLFNPPEVAILTLTP